MEIQLMPLEEHVLWAAERRRAVLEGGLDFLRRRRLRQAAARRGDAQRDQRGPDSGPRYLAASQEITVAGALGDETLPHVPWPEFSFGVVVSGPRRCARRCACS
jgi:hypothetical protein